MQPPSCEDGGGSRSMNKELCTITRQLEKLNNIGFLISADKDIGIYCIGESILVVVIPKIELLQFAGITKY